MKTITRNPDGSLTIRVDTVQKNTLGETVTNSAQWDIQPHQVDAHRNDPEIESAINHETRAALDADQAARRAPKAKA